MIFIRKSGFFISLVFFFIAFVFNSCTKSGCTDPSAENYNSNATEDDGSCVIFGCMDPSAENYNSNATDGDGSCLYPCSNSEYHCLEINFSHFVDDMEIVYGNDNIFYENAAGNIYSVRRLLYVLSDIILFFEDGTNQLLDEFIFVNTDDPETLTKTLYNLSAECTGISFTLGFSTENNIDNQYINNANNFHSLMLWPNLNGTNLAFQGGYHYMKIEGKYIDDEGNEQFYNNHTGPTNGVDLSFEQPIFNFSEDGFTNVASSIYISMNVNNFYNNPIYDFNTFGSSIMANIEAQYNLNQNVGDVFTIQVN
tara:strand:- start:1803 stop:2732 length:930 start_codon:yes stop_codon:yes gene_type:complete